MNWILLLLLVYFLFALVALVDKFILTKTVPQPMVYTFVVTSLGLISLLLIPFGFFVPSWWQLFISLISGACFVFSVFLLYSALKINDASNVFPFIGAFNAVFAFIFSYIFLSERLSINQIAAFLLLLIGGFLISIQLKNKNLIRAGFGQATLSSVFFAASFVAAKFVYSQQPFISGFVWIRIFAFLSVLTFLLNKNNRRVIKNNFNKKSPLRKRSNQLIIIGGQTLGGIGFILLNYVISLTSAAIALAAQGIQYAFLLIFVFILSFRFPKIIKEKFTPLILSQKVIAIFLIGIGLVILAFNNL